MPERVSNQNQQFIDKGLHVFGPSETAEEEVRVITVPITSGNLRPGPQESDGDSYQRTFTAEFDITETLSDGRLIMILRKGNSIPMEEAIRKGIVKLPKDKAAGPSEKKPATGPSESK